MPTDAVISATLTSLDVSIADLDHAIWSKSEPVLITQYWSGEQAPASRHAEARIIWSAASLSVRFVCSHNEPLIVAQNPQTTSKTLGLWDRDVCEIFIAPNPNAPNCYFEFEAAPTGEWVDLAIRMNSDGRDTDFAFESGMTVGTRIEDDQIIVVIQIPWSDEISQPQPGDRWRVNLFRCIGKDPNRGYLAWRPTYTEEPSFHAPEVFGWLEFRDETGRL